MSNSPLKMLDKLIVSGKRAEARRLLASDLKRTPDDHRLVTRMARVLSDEDKDLQAMSWHRRARELAPRCPVVLWDYAETVGGRQAIELFRGLIRRGPLSLSAGCCVPSPSSGRAMITDAYWMVAIWHWQLGDRAEAIRAAKNCLRRVRGGMPGQFIKVRAANTALQWAQAIRP